MIYDVLGLIRQPLKQGKGSTVRGKQILMTALVALAVVVGVKFYETKKG